MNNEYKEWNKKIPCEEGLFWMKDASGGPTLYLFKVIDGVLKNGPLPRVGRWHKWIADGTGHIDSAMFKGFEY